MILECYMNRVVKSTLLGTGVFLGCGFQYHKIDRTNYIIHTKKVNDEIKICVLADLHCRRYGEKQERIKNIVDAMKPDLIVIPGDLFDIDRDFDISFELISAMQGYPVYFTSGNHDNYLKEIDELRNRLRQMGVHVLEDTTEVFQKGNTTIEICGLSDMGRKPNIDAKQLDAMYQTENYRILVSHRPDYIDFYQQIHCNLIVSGHVHGGQWRIPFIHKGIYAPQQGFFPKYYEGIHHLKNQNLVISRGLASGNPYIPRLYNNPEIVCITIKQ